MKRVLAVTTVILWTGLSAFAQSLTQADRDSAIKYLESTRQGVVDATKDLSTDQWNFDPGPERWSLAEVMEHIAAAEDLYFTMVTQVVMKAPARPVGEDVKAIDQMVLAKVPERSPKAQAPDEPVPSNRFSSPDEALKHFLESRDRTIDFLKKTDDLRAHALSGPLGKKLDAYQWILFIAAHSDGHTKQINEVKADPKFPKK
jgi:hypothetical protein